LTVLTSCVAKAQQTPSPCCASRHRAVSPNWPKIIESGRPHGHSAPSLKISCISV